MKMKYVADIEDPFEYPDFYDNDNIEYFDLTTEEEFEALTELYHVDDLHELWEELWYSVEGEEKSELLDEFEKLSHFPCNVEILIKNKLHRRPNDLKVVQQMVREKMEGGRDYGQKISRLYNLCIELGIHGASKGAKWDEIEINRFMDAIKQHCEERDLTLDSYADILTYNIQQRRKEIEENNKGNRYDYDLCDDYDTDDVGDPEIDEGYYDNRESEDET